MKILVHDFAGHPFQAELSRELAARGHEVVHSTCTGYVGGKGNLDAEGRHGLRFETIGRGELDKASVLRRTLQETVYGLEFIRQLWRERPRSVVMSNAPLPMLVMASIYMALARIPWVLWHQDVYSVAARHIVEEKRSVVWRVLLWVFEKGERFSARRAAHIVVIADSFVPVHQGWGTSHKVTVVPNWAPLDEIVPMPRDNDWAREHGLADGVNLLYSGTLGVKHNPELLVELTARVRELGVDARLVVVNTGAAVEVVREASTRLDVPTTLLPFQPYDRLPEVLATGDVLVVLLELAAGAFSVPSKTLSYLCAGRPVLGMMPDENLAAKLLRDCGCEVFAPSSQSVDGAAKWVVDVVGDAGVAAALRASTRELAEQEFSRERCADAFERILEAASLAVRQR